MFFTLSQVAPPQTDPASVPIAVSIALASITLGGLLVWLVGSRLLRPAFVFVGTIVGASVGYVGAQTLSLGIDPLWVGGFGLVTGGILGWIMYRIAVSLSFAVILGAAIATATLSAFQFRPDSNPPAKSIEPPFAEDIESLTDLASVLPQLPSPLLIAHDALGQADQLAAEDAPQKPSPNGLRSALDMSFERGSAFARTLATRIQPLWDGLSFRDRMFLAGSYVLGFLIGLSLGVAAPKRAAGAITAFAGPAIWIPSGVFLIETLQPAAMGWLPDDPMPWLAAWGIAVVIGLVIQWIHPKRRADKG